MDLMGCHVLTDEVGIQLDQSGVVAHTVWLARALDRCYSSGRQFVLLTPTTSRLTIGLTRVLELLGATWVVSDIGGTHYNGITGERLGWDGVRFNPTYEFGDSFLDIPDSPQPGVLFMAEMVHPARSSTQVGRLAEVLCRATTGGNPLGWGVLEPASEPWSMVDLTAQVRDGSMPRAGIVHVVGRAGTRPFSSVTTIERTSSGVVERVTATIPLDEPWGAQERQDFQEAMHEAGARHAVAYSFARGSGLFRSPRFEGSGVPMAGLLGPEVLRERGAAQTLERLGELGHAVDRGRWQSVGVTYPAQPVAGASHPSEHWRELVDWLGA